MTPIRLRTPHGCIVRHHRGASGFMRAPAFAARHGLVLMQIRKADLVRNVPLGRVLGRLFHIEGRLYTTWQQACAARKERDAMLKVTELEAA